VRANRELSEAVLHLRYNSQFFETVQQIFGGKPETLVAGLKDLFGGIAKQLKESE
jgi:hypothetical protein